MNRVCLVVLIGLPGAGKTTFCQHLMQMQFLPFNILHLCYDDLIKFNFKNIVRYKEQRETISKILKETVVHFKNFTDLPKEVQKMNVQYNSHNHSDTIILCDDNHYYRSMRYKSFKIARDEGIGYCQVYLHCKVGFALERNSLRNTSQRIPKEVILEMCNRIEVPNALKYPWEKNTMIVRTSSSWGKSYHEIISFITQILNNPVQPLHVSIFESATPKSKVHELDLLLRKHIKILMSSNQQTNRTLAKKLNDQRKDTLMLLRKDIACGLQDIDISKYVEGVSNV